MLARTSSLIHPLGIEIETPLLVPSFSSKGFGLKKMKGRKHDISEAAILLKFSKEFLTESLLVSGYDLYYKHIPYNEENFVTEVIFIDSGGYETGNSYDLSATTKFNYDLKAWNIDQLKQVISKWPEHKAGIIVSYDKGNHRISLEDQINCAKDLFKDYPLMMTDFLIKPETITQEYVQIENILKNIHHLEGFNFIGVTERELGNSILNRMKNISKIRIALDEIGNKAPIHVFGSLDPITSILYFLAGAEVFDGLTWLKYSYYNNSAIYTSNYGVIGGGGLGIATRDESLKTRSISRNTYYLEMLKYSMKAFVKDHNFNIFDDIGGKGFGELIEKSYTTFKSNL
ncbi:hypothetical protein FUA48_05830 [Flavobacterium alkalisoli]|uniref:Uncharacterized protein n=1 Tax=Flavobacterium alkalisoli TaxID=2602769 RepID=A0A5B9FSL3_9FLAO|nr:hypothetical protein [Flavobacterium alkalisoli]QEE49116.1 hypothetical protein FUA48_05830 [Flavobacterium alkalisoli]